MSDVPTTTKPPMPPFLAPAVDEARRRVRARASRSPGIQIDAVDQGWTFGAPHADAASWISQVMDAFGTNSWGVAQTFLMQLSKLTKQSWNEQTGSWEPDATELTAILAIVSGARPENELQAGLAAQMVAIHLMSMRVSSRALEQGCVDQAAVGLAAKLARTYALLSETMAKLQGRTTKQHITVESSQHLHKHVHMHQGAGDGDSGDQPHEPTRTRVTLSDDAS